MEPNKIRLNIFYVDYLLNPLMGGADDDEACEKYKGVAVETKEQFRAVIRDELTPFFYNFMNETNQAKAKLALSYALSKNDTNFRSIFGPALLPFKIPQDSRGFFACMWEEFFEGEDYHLDDLDQYKAFIDVEEPWRREFGMMSE